MDKASCISVIRSPAFHETVLPYCEFHMYFSGFLCVCVLFFSFSFLFLSMGQDGWSWLQYGSFLSPGQSGSDSTPQGIGSG